MGKSVFSFFFFSVYFTQKITMTKSEELRGSSELMISELKIKVPVTDTISCTQTPK